MSHKKQLQDANICMAISGSDDISNPGMTIVEDYFVREQEENRRESGLPVAWDPDSGRSEREIAMWKHDKALSELEQARTNKPELEYPFDEDLDCGIILPKARYTETIVIK